MTTEENYENLKKNHMDIMIYFVKRNVCPSISWNSVQESSYTQVLIKNTN